MDKQAWYLDPALSPFLTSDDAQRRREVVDRLDSFIATTRASDIPVLWSTMTEGDEHAPRNVLARWVRLPGAPRLRRGDTGFAFAGQGPLPGDFVFEKVYPDAFSCAELVEELRRLGRSTLVVVGAYAGRCVLATAFGAQTRGFDVVIPRGLAVPHPNQPHEESVVEAIIDTTVGHLIEPSVLAELWLPWKPIAGEDPSLHQTRGR